MRILILGAGATGGYYGARLLAAGRDVTFLVRPATAARLAADGLHLLSPRGDLHLPPPPTILTPTGFYDLVFLSCKAQDLASSMDSFAPAVGPKTAILPVLNGMAHMAALDSRFSPHHVLGGTSNISAVRTPDGLIHHLGTADRLFFGTRQPAESASPRLQSIASTLADCNFEQALRPHIQHDLWDKWVTIATSAGITCLLRAAMGDIVHAGGAPLLLELLAECAAIASAEGFPTPQPLLDGVKHFLLQPDSLFTASMLRDLELGAPIEARPIIGDLLDTARRHHLPTPLLEIVNIHLRSYENRRHRERTT